MDFRLSRHRRFRRHVASVVKTTKVSIASATSLDAPSKLPSQLIVSRQIGYLKVFTANSAASGELSLARFDCTDKSKLGKIKAVVFDIGCDLARPLAGGIADMG